jgi:hypothetical protein
MALQNQWVEQFVDTLRQAVAGNELPRSADIDQLVFEITAMLVRANFSWVLTGDQRTLMQASAGIRHVLDRVKCQTGRKGLGSRKRAN